MKRGFYFTFGNKGIFLESDRKNKTDAVARAIIDEIAKVKTNLHPDTIARAKADRQTLDDFKRRTDYAILSEHTTENGTNYYMISGENFSVSYPVADFENDIILATV